MTTPYRPIDALPPLTPAIYTIRDVPTTAHPVVVSADSSSPEALISYKASQIEKQLAVDTKYDAIVERFCSGGRPSPTMLLLLSVIVLGTVASLGMQRK